MNLDFGSKERFFDFIKKMGDEDVVALVSHNDLDGIASAIVTNKVLEADHLHFVNYEDLNHGLVDDLRVKGVTKIVFTDLFVGDEEFLNSLESFAEVLVIDHHLVPKDFNSARTVYIKGETGYCAASLCYELFSWVTDLEQFDWIVACASIADYCYEKNAEWMKKVFAKYGQKFDLVMIKDSRFWNLQWAISLALIYFKDNPRRVYDSIGIGFGDIGRLGEFAGKVEEELNELIERFKREKVRIPGGYYWEFTPRFKVTSIVSSVLSGAEPDKKFILSRLEGSYCYVSARKQDKKENMAEFLQRAIEGFENSSAGGHVPAAGCHFMRKDLGVFRSRIGVD